MYRNQLAGFSSCGDYLRSIEADIHHANSLAAAIQQDYGGARIQMRLSCNSFAPMLLFLIRWLEITCVYDLPGYLGLLDGLVCKVCIDGKSGISSFERRAGLGEFYGVIYPSLQQLASSLTGTDDGKEMVQMDDIFGRLSEKGSRKEADREDECGICLEACSKMVLPNCNHSMCINCYHDWNTRSESCPFCRGSLKRVSSSDLWVLTSDGDVVDPTTILQENLRHLYLYINNLPLAMPDSLSVGNYEYLI